MRNQNREISYSNYLQYGCEISFSHQDSGYICSSGFIDNLLFLKKAEESLDYPQCIFRVLPYCIHSIQANLNSDISSLKDQDIKSLKEQDILAYQEKYLKFNEILEGEIQSNLLNYQKNYGNPIRFGSVVYLQHVASQKFLTVIYTETGIMEKYSFKVALTDFPSDYSYIKIEPSYNFQKEGEGYIRMNDIVQLEVFVTGINKATYINASSKEIPKESHEVAVEVECREINASPDNKMKWRVNFYSFSGGDKKKLLNYGDCIWISNSEGGVILTTLKNDDSLVLHFNKNQSDSNGLWRIEKEDYFGGCVHTEDNFLLRHMTSGLYLTLKKDEAKQKIVGELTAKKDESCLWSFESIYQWESHAKIEIDHFFFLINSKEKLKLQGIEENKQMNFIKLDFNKSSSESAFFKLFKADPTFLWETQFTINCVQVISRFMRYIKEINGNSEKDLIAISKDLKKRSEMIQSSLNEMGNFLEHKLSSSFSTGKNYGQIDKVRQKVFKEISIIDLLSNLLDIMFSGEFSLVKLGSYINETHNLKENDPMGSIVNSLKSCTKKIYEVLSKTCQENSMNQVYAFKFFPIYQKHGGYELGGTKCMRTILMNNEQLISCLEEGSLSLQLGQNEVPVIEYYIWLLRKFHRDRKPHLIEFLSETCVCRDNGIQINQNIIHSKLFLNPQTFNKGIIATSIVSENKSLAITVDNKEGVGEVAIPLLDCFDNGKTFESFEKEIIYFTNTLSLFANMCKGRNSTCKESISKWYPINVILNNVWEDKLSNEIRAAFLQMLMSMHIDSAPRVKEKKPELIRSFEPLKSYQRRFKHRHSIITKKFSSKILTKKYNEGETSSFRDKSEEFNIIPVEAEIPIFYFKCKLIKFFLDLSEPAFDVLLLQMLKAANMLVKFEVISIEESDFDRKNSVLNIETFAENKSDIITLLKGVSKILFYNLKQKVSGLSFMKEPLEDVAEKQSNPSKLKDPKINLDDPFRRFSEGLRHHIYIHSLRSIDDSDVESIEIQCKLEMCDLLLYGICLRDDFLISNALSWLNSNSDKGNLEFDVDALMPPIIKNFSICNEVSGFTCFHKPVIEHLTTIHPKLLKKLLLLFIISKNYKLQTKVLEIVFRMFSQRKELLKNLKRLTIMSQYQDGETFYHAKRQMSIIKSYSTQASIICFYWNQSGNDYSNSLKSVEHFNDLIQNMKSLIYANSGEKKINSDRQVMLRYLKFHKYIVNFINNGLNALEEIYDDAKSGRRTEARNKLIGVFTRCFEVLTLFVSENKKNQDILHPSLEILLKNIRMQLGQIDLVCEIFKNNINLCYTIDEQLLNLFTELILNEGRKPEFLKFFNTIALVSNEPVPHLQRLILNVLTKKDHCEYLLDMKNDKFLFSSNLIGDDESKDSPFYYHELLIRVLSKCGTASIGFKLTQIKCQKILKCKYAYELLLKNEEYEVLHCALLEFFTNIYLEKECFHDSTESDVFLNFIINNRGILSSKKFKNINLQFTLLFIKMMYKYLKLLVGHFKIHEAYNDLIAMLYSKNEILKVRIIDEIKYYVEIIQTFFQDPEFPIEFNSIKNELEELAEFFEIELKIIENFQEGKVYLGTIKEETFKDFFKSLDKSKFSSYVKAEQQEFLNDFSLLGTISKKISTKKIIKCLLEYVNLSSINRPPVQILFSVIEFLGFNLGPDEKIAQNRFREMNVVQIIMKLMCDKFVEPKIFAILVEFSTKLLKGGNDKIQEDFFNYFISNSASENFFAALYSRITNFTEKISVISDSERKKSKNFERSSKIISRIIKLLQLFCENHFETHQNYLRKQDNSRKNYNLIEAVIFLLRELMVKKKIQYFTIMNNCFELLTESIQGPCKLNQKSIINSKFLEIVNELLSLEYKSKTLSTYHGLNSTYQIIEDGENLLEVWMISQLKFKCLITIIGLLEGRTDTYMVVRVFRAFNLLLFKENLVSIYSLYIEHSSEENLKEDVFGRLKINDEENESLYNYKVAIKTGFLILQLLNNFKQIDDPEIIRLMTTDLKQLYEEEFNSVSVSILPHKFFFKGIDSAKKFLGVQQVKTKEDLLNDAIKYFQKKTGSVEIVFKGSLFKFYFWLPPICSYLTDDTKKEFHSQADRSSEKAKLEYLIASYPKILKDMEYEQTLSNFFGYKFFSSQIATVKVILFILTLYINVIILASYQNFNEGRLDKPNLGYIQSTTPSSEYHSVEKTKMHIYAIGIVHCVLSCAVFLYFSVKIVPLIVKTELEDIGNYEGWKKWKQIFKVVGKCFLKIDVIYQLWFFIFSILGLTWHPFFFSIHLLDILYRIPSLQSVIMSVALPWRSLVLTLFLIIIINYLFSIWAYIDFYEQFNQNCDSLILCFRTIFDQGYKNSGGIGMWLDFMSLYEYVEKPEKSLVISRYFFDDIYLIIIPILMANIIYGLILDTFSVLYEMANQSKADKENKCFICGKEKVDIERLTRKPFLFHTYAEHNEWNYIFFIAYLEIKTETELSGIESYIKDSFKKNEVDWIPQHQGLSFMVVQEEENNSNAIEIKNIQASLAVIDQELKKLKKLSS